MERTDGGKVRYSITSSARASTDCGTVNASAFAVSGINDQLQRQSVVQPAYHLARGWSDLAVAQHVQKRDSWLKAVRKSGQCRMN